MYPEYIMRYVRQNLDLEPDDTSKDSIINKMSHDDILSRVCEWNGLINYGSTIRNWIQSIYHVSLS